MFDGIAEAHSVGAGDREEALVDGDEYDIDHQLEAGEEGKALKELST